MRDYYDGHKYRGNSPHMIEQPVVGDQCRKALQPLKRAIYLLIGLFAQSGGSYSKEEHLTEVLDSRHWRAHYFLKCPCLCPSGIGDRRTSLLEEEYPSHTLSARTTGA